MYRVVTSAPADRNFNVTAQRIGGGVLLASAAASDPAGIWSKALGLGVSEPVSAGLMDHIFDFYRRSGVASATVQFVPGSVPPDWEEIMIRHDLRPGIRWAKLVRPARAPAGTPPVTTLRVTIVRPDQVGAWARVLLLGFGVTSGTFEPMLTAAATREEFEPFAAWDGGQMIAAAALFRQGPGAQMVAASTLASHQGRGAQSALLRARIRRAADSGARWISAEASAGRDPRSNSSLNNAQRAGFRILHVRDTWIWRPASVSRAQPTCR